jgi:alpha-galactosidase
MSTETDAGASTVRDPGGLDGCLQLRAGGVGLILDCTGDRLPRVLYWGPDLGALPADELEDLRRASEPPLVSGQEDVVVPVSFLP